MNATSGEPLQQFLETSSLCDAEHPSVQRTAASIVTCAANDKEAAIKIYYFVRDEIKHAWSPLPQKASTTLECKVGDCWPKSILQVAMLRAIGIPARYRWIEYHKHLFRDLVPSVIYEKLSDPFPFHVLAEVYINDCWTLADATFDKELCPDRTPNWDGFTNMIALRPDEISRDLGFTASFEERQPEIDAFFGGSPIGPTDDRIDVESELVNMYFEFIRFRNRVDQTFRSVLQAKQ
jgi:transglutaminase-like putative cysteine protease